MGFTIEKPLPSAAQILSELPLDETTMQDVKTHQQEIKDIISGKDPRKLLIIGPCSAWRQEAVLEYAEKLKPLADQVEDQIKIVMRVYIQKPRTTIGWLGPINQPDPFAAPDLTTGIRYCREMMIKIAQMGLAIADEALFTHNDDYFVDLISWIAIGARSTEDQEHRIFASMIGHPVGLKNPTSGDIEKGVNSIVAAQYEHVFGFHGNQIKTHGNPHAHLILRGGNGVPNCDQDSLLEAIGYLEKAQVKNPALVVDISHDNSICPEAGVKDPTRQPAILSQLLSDMNANSSINAYVKGFMVESFLQGGKQNLKDAKNTDELVYGKSITDGCLSWEDTEKMVLTLADQLKA